MSRFLFWNNAVMKLLFSFVLFVKFANYIVESIFYSTVNLWFSSGLLKFLQFTLEYKF